MYQLFCLGGMCVFCSKYFTLVFSGYGNHKEFMADTAEVSANSSSPLGKKGELVTFILQVYNQESCIEPAVKGALSQTYSPLEIIFSDDCSTDRTFEKMQELVEGYDGPHKIVFNRNEKNLGIAAHFDKAVSLSHGDFIIGAAGDDTSLPERTTRLVQKWLESGRQAKIVISNYYRFGEDGEEIFTQTKLPAIRNNPLMDIIERNKPKVTVHGALAAFDVELFNQFGPMIEGLVNEDRILLFRCLLLGGRVESVEDPLIQVQTGGRSRHKDILVLLAARVKSVEQHLLDLQRVDHVEGREALIKSCEWKHAKYRVQLLLMRRDLTFSQCHKICGNRIKLWLLAAKECIMRAVHRGVYRKLPR